jgi:hypothetical protein
MQGFGHKGFSYCVTHKTIMEMFGRVKHSSLLSLNVNNVAKMFCSNDPWPQCYKTFYCHNLRMFVISRPFQPNLMFVGKAKNLGTECALFRNSPTYPQTLD